MAIGRQENWLGQQRVDVPHLRAVESAVAGDFDLLAGRMVAGNSALVLTGFTIPTSQALNAPATNLTLNAASGVLVHPLASESGSIFSVPSTRPLDALNSTNARVVGSFTAGQVNYVGVDLRRTADAATSDVVQFLDTGTYAENPKTVALARTLDYVVTITTADFSTTPGLCPVAKVTTDASNNVTAIQDARQMAFRLGSGGSVPQAQFAYPWPGSRVENTSGDVFSGGDKAIGSFKDWMNAAMSRIWEIGGGPYWYSPTADRNVTMVRTGAAMVDGEWFTWDGTNLTWQGLHFLFDNTPASGVYYNQVADQTSSSAGLTDLSADGACIYVDLDRTQNCGAGGTAAALTAVKGNLQTLGAPVVPGARQVVAWRKGAKIFTRGSSFPVGATFNVATTTSLGLVQLGNTPPNPSIPLVATYAANNRLANTATGGNAVAFDGTGNGNGAGILGTGGATNGAGVSGQGTGSGTGVLGTGGATNGAGVTGQGTGQGSGVVGTGGGSLPAYGVAGTGGSAGGYGVQGTGTGVYEGVYGTGGGGVASGIRGLGSGYGAGAYGTGGPTNSGGVLDGVGGYFVGGAGGSAGVYAVGSGSAPGVRATSNAGTNVDVIKGNGYVDLSGGTNPASTTGFSNRLTPKNICKAWVSIRVTGDGAGGMTINDGFNISGISAVSGAIQVSFTTSMGSNAFAVTACGYNSTSGRAIMLGPVNKAAGNVQLVGDNGAAALNFSTTNNVFTIDVAVYGPQ